jgi:hypothetical protein
MPPSARQKPLKPWKILRKDSASYQNCYSYKRAMPLFLFEPDQWRFIRAFGLFAMGCFWLASR